MDNDETLKWLSSLEGQTEYITWFSKLVDCASRITGIPAEVSIKGEIVVWVRLEENDIPPFIKQNPNYDKKHTAFRVEYQLKDIIIRELLKLVELRNTQKEFGYAVLPDAVLFESIEKTITKDLCKKLIQVKENTKKELWSNQAEHDEKTNKNFNNLLTTQNIYGINILVNDVPLLFRL